MKQGMPGAVVECLARGMPNLTCGRTPMLALTGKMAEYARRPVCDRGRQDQIPPQLVPAYPPGSVARANICQKFRSRIRLSLRQFALREQGLLASCLFDRESARPAILRLKRTAFLKPTGRHRRRRAVTLTMLCGHDGSESAATLKSPVIFIDGVGTRRRDHRECDDDGLGRKNALLPIGEKNRASIRRSSLLDINVPCLLHRLCFGVTLLIAALARSFWEQ